MEPIEIKVVKVEEVYPRESNGIYHAVPNVTKVSVVSYKDYYNYLKDNGADSITPYYSTFKSAVEAQHVVNGYFIERSVWEQSNAPFAWEEIVYASPVTYSEIDCALVAQVFNAEGKSFRWTFKRGTEE